MRAFVAVDVDEPTVVARVAEIQKALGGLRLDAKMVEPHNLHITLRFMGEISDLAAGQAARELAKISYPRFRLAFKGLGAFPDVVRPRVLWVGVAEGATQLAELAEIVRKAVDRYSAHQEERDFTPHLTICRIKSGLDLDKLAPLLERWRDLKVGEMWVTKVKLKRSVLTPQGPIYSDVATVELH